MLLICCISCAAEDALPMEVLRAVLDGALGTQSAGVPALSTDWGQRGLKVPSKPNHITILQFSMSDYERNYPRCPSLVGAVWILGLVDSKPAIERLQGCPAVSLVRGPFCKAPPEPMAITGPHTQWRAHTCLYQGPLSPTTAPLGMPRTQTLQRNQNAHH